MPSSAVDRFARFCKILGLTLEPFQRKIVAECFGDQRETLILLPRGNGKSTLLAALALFHLLGRADAKIAIGAASREQAGTLFEFARNMAAHPAIAERVEITRREIRTAEGWIKVVASDGPKQHGLVLTLAIVDELHAHRDEELYIALRTGMLKQPDAKMWTISTAGIGEDSALGKLHTRAMNQEVARKGSLLTAHGPNLSMLEWALPDDADIDDMSIVSSVNPASWLTEDALAEQREAVHEIAFRRYHCNQWVSAEAPWITADTWDTCKGEPRIPEGSRIVLGVDAAVRHDSTCVAMVYLDSKGVFHTQFRIWEPTRGREVELESVMDYIREVAKHYDIAAVAYDPYFLWHAAQRLESEGLNMVEWRQDNTRMVPATRTLHEAVTHGKLRHGGDPTARSHALACGVFETERGVRIKKTASHDRIDAIVALAMAVDWASRTEEEPKRSVYETRGLVAA